MSLTKGTGPFGSLPAGSFNFDPHRPEHVLYVEDTPLRVRVVFGGETIADSSDVKILHPPERTPTYLFPSADVRAEFLEPGDRQDAYPGLGTATYWTVVAGGRTADNSAYSFPQPPESAAVVTGYIAFDWDAMDTIFEEDEEVIVHPRDPYTRIDVRRTHRHVQVRRGDTVVAESTSARMLMESGLPVRYYLPQGDVRVDSLEPSETTTRCPYKGLARYWSLRDGDELIADAVWSYPDPFHDAEAVRDMMCFVDDTIEIDVTSAPAA